ncbi:MAG: lytic transglycosylase domain-containing protein [Rhodobacteraceae bacterium]|nr:lytic transglycosylase domain-containing protein [Paracoccaceae bacterium]
MGACAAAVLAAAVATALLAGPAGAEGADFTFRRVKPPGPGAGPRITVRIDPAEQARLLALRPAVPPPPAAGAPAPGEAPAALPFAWFWEAVSPDLGATAGRFQAALAALAAEPADAAVPVPRLAELQAIAAAHGPAILAATVGRQVSPALVLAVIGIESGGRPAAVSGAGATGLMQLVPDTAARFGVADATDPVANITGGTAYLDWLMGEFGRDPVMVLAAYNAGEGAVRAHGGVPPFAETRAYVPKVLAAWTLARGLCLTPPELVSDGCVFRTALRE